MAKIIYNIGSKDIEIEDSWIPRKGDDVILRNNRYTVLQIIHYPEGIASNPTPHTYITLYKKS